MTDNETTPQSPLEAEYEYTLVADTQDMCELCITLMRNTYVIRHDPANAAFTRENLVPTCVFISLCALDDDTLLAARALSKTVRIMHHCIGNGDHAECADTVSTLAEVIKFHVNDFMDYVPVDDAMFSCYITDKILLTLYPCCYKTKFYAATPESGQLLLAGAKFQNKSLGEALCDMIDTGTKCFEREAEYCMIGRISQQMIDRVNDIRMLYGQAVMFQNDQVTGKIYKLAMGELPAYNAKYNGILGTRSLSADALTLQVYPHDNELLEDVLLPHGMHWYDGVHNYEIKYTHIGNLLTFLRPNSVGPEDARSDSAADC